jgi:hypothetical protein
MPKQSTVIQSLEISPGRVAKLEMPADLTSEEAAMLIKIIELFSARGQ